MNKTGYGDNSLVSLADTSVSVEPAANIERLQKLNGSLNNEVMTLKYENAALRNNIPPGKGLTTDAFVRMARELEDAKEQKRHWENQTTEQVKKFSLFQRKVGDEIDSLEKDIKLARDTNVRLEAEIAKLRSQSADDRAYICRLEKDNETGQSFFCSDNDNQQQTSLPVENVINEQHERQLAAKDKKIEKLEEDLKNAHTAVNAFLSAQKNKTSLVQNFEGELARVINESGVNLADVSNADKIADIVRNMLERRRNKIRANNESLCKEYRGKSAAVDALFQQLDDDSMMNTTELNLTNMDLGQLPQFQWDLQPVDTVNTSKFKAVEQKNAKMGDVVSDLINRTSTMAEVCVMMFQRLRGTAEFFRNLLSNLGVEGEDLLQKIDDYKLDLDKSLGEAKSILDEAKNAEKTFRGYLEETQKALSGQVAELETVLHAVTTSKETLAKQVAELNDRLQMEMANGASLANKVADLETKLAEERGRAIPDKEKMVLGIREELSKICNTLAVASTRCSRGGSSSSAATLKRSGRENIEGGGK